MTFHEDDKIMDPLTFGRLMLEIDCNLPKEKITEKEVWKQFEEDILTMLVDARSTLATHMDEIIEQSRRNKE
jgi:hypothetical protein